MKKLSQNGIKTKGIGSFLALLSFTAYMPISCMQAFANDMVGVNTLPEINKAVNGEVSTSGNVMNVSVNGGTGTVGQFDWNTFNVGRNAQVNWVFNANSQTALNRVLASGGMSYIYGKLTQSAGSNCPDCVNTSKVILINPSGIMFGNGSSVNLNSFTASTFDIKGAKDLKDLSDAELTAYAGTITKESGKNGGLFNIAGYNKSIEFVANDNMVDGNGYVVADATGTRLASIVADGAHFYGSQNVTIKDDKNGDIQVPVGNKTVAMIGNKIDVNNSKIETTYESKPNAANYQQTRSNVRLVTGDGVNFYYTSNGNIENTGSYKAATKKSNKEEQGISIANSEIRTGDFYAHNGVADNGSIKVNNSKIYTKKLLGTSYNGYTAEQTGTSGNLVIESKGTTSVAKSDLRTLNDTANDVNSKSIQKGNMVVAGTKGVTISDSQLKTANSTDNKGEAGTIYVLSKNGNINIKSAKVEDGSNITSAGDMVISSGKSINVNKYNISAGNNLDMLANNTTVDNSIVEYNNLKLYDDSTVNNVTLKNDTRMNDRSSKGLNIVTNGNLTVVDSQLLKKAGTESSKIAQKFYNLKSTEGNVKLNGAKLNTTEGNIAINAKKNIDASQSKFNSKSGNIYLTSNDDIILQNSLIATKTGNASLSANKVEDGAAADKTDLAGSISSYDSKINAKNINIIANNSVDNIGSQIWAKGGNVNVVAKNGRVIAKGYNVESKENEATIVSEGGTTTITQAKDIDLNNDFEKSLVGGTKKLTLKSTQGSIIGKNLVQGSEDIGAYEKVLTLKDTSKNARFTLAKNAEIEAGKNIDLAGKGNMRVANLTTNAKGTAKITSKGDLTINGLDVKGGTKTTLEGATISTPSGKINANGNKIALNSPGNINAKVSGISNPDNGLEVNAEINTGVKDNNRYSQEVLNGRNVTIDAGDETLAISKIKADTLTLKAKDFVAGKTKITNNLDNLGYVKEDGTLYQAVKDTKNSRAYIEVKTDGGFNLDPTNKYDDSNKNIAYTKNITSSTVKTTENVGDPYQVVKQIGEPKTTKVKTISTLKKSTTENVEEIGREEASRKPVGEERVVNTTSTTEPIRDENGVIIGNRVVTTDTVEQDYEVTDNVKYSTKTTEVYTDRDITKTVSKTKTTTKQDYKTTINKEEKQHLVKLDENQKEDAFVLVYSKKTEEVKEGTKNVGSPVVKTDKVMNSTLVNKARTEVKDGDPAIQTEKRTITDKNERIKTVDLPCEPEEDIIPGLYDDDISSWVRNPRKSEGISDQAPIQNDLADTSSAVVAAAARLQLDEDDEEDYEN